MMSSKKIFRLIIAGGRDYKDFKTLCKLVDKLLADKIKQGYHIVIVSGGARGADKLGEKWAIENNIPTQIFLPDWGKHGKSAGFVRNEDIVQNSDVVIAFWDGKSRGTNHSIGLAKKYDKELMIIRFSLDNQNLKF